MADEPDMDAPVTRRELREELEKYPTRAQLREELANYPTRKELHEALELWAGNLERRVTVELTRQIRASEERMRDFMRGIFEPVKDHPERVTKVEELEPRVERLEAKVFAPKRRRAAKRR